MSRTKYPLIDSRPEVQAEYERIRKNLKREARQKGEPSDPVSDHRFAEMLVRRSPPRAMTDREFFAGVGTLEDQFRDDPEGLQDVLAGARRRGHKPSLHDFYNDAIADSVGDPLAFVPPTGGRGHVKKVLEQRGMSCSGSVNVKGKQPEKDPFSA